MSLGGGGYTADISIMNSVFYISIESYTIYNTTFELIHIDCQTLFENE